MDKLSIFEAKARFSEVISRAEEGKQTVITKRGKVVARVVPENARGSERWDRSGCNKDGPQAASPVAVRLTHTARSTI